MEKYFRNAQEAINQAIMLLNATVAILGGILTFMLFIGSMKKRKNE